MVYASTVTLSRFAALPGGTSAISQRRSGFAGFFLAPFRDVDDRPARKAAAAEAERRARLGVTSAAAGRHR